MALTDEQVAQLSNEIAQARKARQAYELYIKDHISTTVDNIYAGIESCASNDSVTLSTLKGLLTAVRGLERSVLNDIDTGALAEATLESER